MSDKNIVFRCFEVSQPIGTFYLGAMDSWDLISISFADIRRLEERDIERYLGIQRTLNNKRVKEIEQYVNTIDATFPTAVILAIDSENAEYNHELGVMRVKKVESVAKILDGQHRIAGLKGYNGDRPFMVNVAIFVDMDIEDQAAVFATINLAQTKVSKSLAYDLYAYAKSRSPQKTAHQIARVLNREEESPFYHKIKILGRATKGRDETITQSAFVESLMPYMTSDPVGDRDALKRGKRLSRALADPGDLRFLRNMFIDERDADIARIVWNYFDAVRLVWPDAWARVVRGNILNRTTGFKALMKFLPHAHRAKGLPETVVSPEAYLPIFRNMELNGEDFNPEQFPPGGSGESKLYRTFLAESQLD